MQPQGHVQVLLNVLRGFTVQAALDAPRFCISALPNVEKRNTRNNNSEIYFEDGFPEHAIRTLEGWSTIYLSIWVFDHKLSL